MSESNTVNLRVEVHHDVEPCEANGKACTLCGEVPWLNAASVSVRGIIAGTGKTLFTDRMYICGDCGEELEMAQ